MTLCLYVIEVLDTRRHRYVELAPLAFSLAEATHRKFELQKNGKKVRVRKA